MIRKGLSHILLSLLWAATVATGGCEGKAKFVNSGPSDVSLSRDRCYIWTGGQVKFVASATDEDGDPLIFSWRATKGSFSPPSATGPTVSWIAPDDPGMARITMSVTDELETVTRIADVMVGVPFPENIVTMTIENRGYVYILKRDNPATVPYGSVLTIEPGVVVIIDGKYGGFSVDGTLLALGTPAEHIKFLGNTFSGGSDYWTGIYANGKNARIRFQNVEVANGDVGIQANNGAAMELHNCTIYDNSSVGIQAAEKSVADVRSCLIIQNGTGVYIRNSDAVISLTSIRDNDGSGIEMSATTDSSYMALDSSVIANNAGNGIVLVNRASPRIRHCSIFNVEPTAGTFCVRLASYTSLDTVHAEDNFWGIGFDTAPEIARVIFDRTDSPLTITAWVRFDPWLVNPPVTRETQ